MTPPNNSDRHDHVHYNYNSDDSHSFTTFIARVSQVFAISVLLLLCLAANGLLVYAVLRTRCRNSVLNASSLLLINLAAADFLVGALVLPMWIVSTSTLSWPLPGVLCKVTAFLTVALMVCSILSLAAIAVDRWLNLAYPLRYPTEMTSGRLVAVLLSIWALCFFVAGLPLCGWGQYRFQPQTVPICNPVWVSEVGYAIFLVLGGLLVPFTAMLAAYIHIVHIARTHLAKIEATRVLSVRCQQEDTTIFPETTATGLQAPPGMILHEEHGKNRVSSHRPAQIGNAWAVSNNGTARTLPETAVTSDSPQVGVQSRTTSLDSGSTKKLWTASSSSSSSSLLLSVVTRPFMVSQRKAGTCSAVRVDTSLLKKRHLSLCSAPMAQRTSAVIRIPVSTGWTSRRVLSKSVNIANRVFVAVGLFFLCWGPYVILSIWSVNHADTVVPYCADLLTTLLAFANNAVNPVLFLLINKDYRMHVRTQGRRCWKHCSRRDHVQAIKPRSMFFMDSTIDSAAYADCVLKVSGLNKNVL